MEDKKLDIQEKPVSEGVKNYQDVHKRSFKEIAKETIKENPTSETLPLETLDKKIEEVKEKKERKKREDITEKVAETVKLTLAEERKAEKEAKEKAAAEEEKQKSEKKAEEEIKSKKNITPKWVEEKRTPQTYEEIYEESKRAALEEMEARLAERELIKQKAQEEETKQKKLQEEQQKQQSEELENRIQMDLNELYEEEKLPRIKNEKDPNDSGVKAREALFKAGMELNNERIAKGLPPVTDLKRIFYERYKAPDTQPAGADAPVMGNTPVTTPDDSKVNYQQIHKKSYRQIIEEALRRKH